MRGGPLKLGPFPEAPAPAPLAVLALFITGSLTLFAHLVRVLVSDDRLVVPVGLTLLAGAVVGAPGHARALEVRYGQAAWGRALAAASFVLALTAPLWGWLRSEAPAFVAALPGAGARGVLFAAACALPVGLPLFWLAVTAVLLPRAANPPGPRLLPLLLGGALLLGVLGVAYGFLPYFGAQRTLLGLSVGFAGAAMVAARNTAHFASVVFTASISFAIWMLAPTWAGQW